MTQIWCFLLNVTSICGDSVGAGECDHPQGDHTVRWAAEQSFNCETFSFSFSTHSGLIQHILHPSLSGCCLTHLAQWLSHRDFCILCNTFCPLTTRPFKKQFLKKGWRQISKTSIEHPVFANGWYSCICIVRFFSVTLQKFLCFNCSGTWAFLMGFCSFFQ